MALSGSVSTNKYSTKNNGTIGLILSWTATQSIVDNTTTINWTLKSNGTMSSGYYVQAGPVTVKIAGTTVLNTTTRFNMRGSGSYSKSGTIRVQHNEDGTKSVSMSVRAAIYSASVNCTGSKTFALNNITRYALLNSVTDFTDEVENDGYPTIEYTNPAGTELVDDVKIRITWDNGNDYTAWHDLNDGGADSPYTFDSSSLTAADITRMLQFCTTSNTLTVRFDLRSTLGGTEYHHYKDAVMTIVNAEPTPGAVSFADVDPDVPLITGDDSIIVQLQSTLQIATANSSANKYASIVSYSLNFNGTDTDITADKYLDIVKPNYSGTFTATVTTTDSRGNSATATATITITPWGKPAADCSAERVNGFETNTTLLVDGSISSVTGSSMTIEEKHSDDGGQTWDGPNPVSDNTPTTIALNNQKDWTIVVLVSDAFDTTTYTLTVGKGIPNVAIGKNWSSLGINGYPEKDGQILVGEDGEIKVDGVVLPHTYDSSEKKIGYWINGEPIYEKTIELPSDVTVNANAWNNNVYTNSEDIILVGCKAFHHGSGVYVGWSFMGFQSSSSDKTKVCLYNSRDASCQVNVLIIQYIKPT